MIISNDTNNFGGFLLGSGHLYAMKASEYTDNTAVADMDEIGYISGSASFKRTSSNKEITTANYGVIDVVNTKYDTTFETGVISYNAQNIKKYLTGSDVVVDTATGTETMYFSDSDRAPAVALVFAGEDKELFSGVELVIPKAKFVGDYELNFNVDNPVEINYSYKCLSTKLSNGKRGTAYFRKTVTPAQQA